MKLNKDDYLEVINKVRILCELPESAIKKQNIFFKLKHETGETNNYFNYCDAALNYKNRISCGHIDNKCIDTLTIFVGNIFSKEPQYNENDLTESQLLLLENVDLKGNCVEDFTYKMAIEFFKTNRLGIYIDSSFAGDNVATEKLNGNRAYISYYPAESILDYGTDSKGNLNFVELKECTISKEFNSKTNKWENKEAHYIRVIERLNDKEPINVHYYKVDNNSKRESVEGYPKQLKLDLINNEFPFKIFPYIDYSIPLLTQVAEGVIALFHYDTLLAKLCAKVATIPLYISDGSGNALQDDITGQKKDLNPDAIVQLSHGGKIDFATLNGNTGDILLKRYDALKKELFESGSSALNEERGGGNISTDTAILNASGDNAKLQYAIEKIEECIEWSVNNMLKMNYEILTNNFSIELNNDFSQLPANDNNITTWRETWLKGGCSTETYMYNLQKLECYPPEHDMEAEKTALEAERARILGINQATDTVNGSQGNDTIVQNDAVAGIDNASD